MSVKNTVRRQYIKLIQQTSNQICSVPRPQEGWITTLRKALAMSGVQLAKRLGVTRAAIYQAERSERNGTITFKQMEKIAQALGGKFIYAIVSERQIEELIRQQAKIKAEALVKRVSAHMALEQQSLPLNALYKEIEELVEEMIRNPSSDFWDND